MEPEHGFTPIPKNLQLRVGLLLGLAIMVAAGFVIYALHARGVFEAKQRLILIADNAEGVAIGMDLTFAGFPIGRVDSLALAPDGRARIEIELARKDARWLRSTTLFALERGLFGAARMRAYSGNMKDPPMPDGAERPMIRGDASEEIPGMVATLKSALENVKQMTSTAGSLQSSLENVRAATDRLGGRHGALGVALGPEEAQKVVATIERANALVASVDRASRGLEGLIGKAEERVMGAGGVVGTAQGVVTEASSILGEIRDSLKKTDAILADAQVAGANAKAATTDLAALRAELEVGLRKVNALIEEVNRKWPLTRDTEIRLP